MYDVLAYCHTIDKRQLCQKVYYCVQYGIFFCCCNRRSYPYRKQVIHCHHLTCAHFQPYDRERHLRTVSPAGSLGSSGGFRWAWGLSGGEGQGWAPLLEQPNDSLRQSCVIACLGAPRRKSLSRERRHERGE